MAQKPVDTEQIRKENTCIIIKTLRSYGAMARIDLVDKSGLSPATISTITATLLENGMIKEFRSNGIKSSKPGRPRVLIDLNPNAQKVISIKLSINRLIISLGDFKGDIILKYDFEFKSKNVSAHQLCKYIVNKIEVFLREHNLRKKQIAAIGIGVQGLINKQLGTIVWSVALSKTNIPIKATIEKLLKIPVNLENDANCIAHAIVQSPRFRHESELAIIMLGYGVGMGLTIDRHLYRGANGAAAEFGHTKYTEDGPLCNCGKRGCIEAYVGDYAIYRQAQELLKMPQVTNAVELEGGMKKLRELALSGQKTAQDIFYHTGVVLGFGICNLIGFLNPSTIFITGSGIASYPLMEKGVRDSINKNIVSDLSDLVEIKPLPWDNDFTLKGLNLISIDTLLSYAD